MTPAVYALSLYTGLLGLIAVWLFANVGKIKGDAKVFMGDGGNPRVIRAMRGQANFVENVPLILIMLLIAALLNAPVAMIHIYGIVLVVGRFFHALHFTRADAPRWQRAVGAITTFLSLASLSLGLIGHAVFNLL